MKFPEEIFPDNQEVTNAFNLAEHTNRSIFITGKAGTGKSTFLKNFCEHTKKIFLVLAPTGIAALNVKGQTIHSFFGLPLRPLYPNDRGVSFFSKTKYDKDGYVEIDEHFKRKLIRKVDVIIIDEISMVRPDIVDAIDESLRKNGGDPYLPFGGKQMIFMGDLFQLEPVVPKQDQPFLSKFYNSPFFFSARVFNNLDLSKIAFTKIYRQTDKSFISLLNSIRKKEADYDDFQELNLRYQPNYEPSANDYFIILCSTNGNADNINNKHLNDLESTSFNFKGSIDGNFESRLPAPLILNLKCGAQVMFVKNDLKGRWVNGSIGKICKLSKNHIVVKILDEGKEKEVVVETAEWEKTEYKWNEEKQEIEQEVTGSYHQYPLKLAWAVTVHKSQGLTFDQVIIDAGRGMFAHGQLYVALSRCTTFEGLILKTPIRMRDMIVDSRILNQADMINTQEEINEQLQEGYEERVFMLKTQLEEKPNNTVLKQMLKSITNKIKEQSVA